MKRQIINLTGKPIRFLTLPTLKPDSAPLREVHLEGTPDYAINGIPIFVETCIASRELPPLPKACRFCGGGYNPEGSCRECDGLGFDRNAPLYIVTREVHFRNSNRRDFLSVNEDVNGEVISLWGPAR